MTDEAENSNSADTRGTTVPGIRDLIERTFLAGLGAAVLTKDRIQELVEDLVGRGQINADEGREMIDRLVSRSREEARMALKKADSSLQGAYRDMGLSTKRELEDLDFRLRQVEMRVQLLEKELDSQRGSETAS